MKYNKEEIKEIILTDYLDNRLSKEDRRKIDQIIAQDSELKEFYQAAVKTSVEPFEQVRNIQPPQRVWENIKEQVTPLPPREYHIPVIDLWIGWIRKPNIPFALSSLMAVIMLITFLGVHRYQVNKKNIAENQIEYLMMISNTNADSLSEQKKGFGTNIENYFL